MWFLSYVHFFSQTTSGVQTYFKMDTRNSLRVFTSTGFWMNEWATSMWNGIHTLLIFCFILNVIGFFFVTFYGCADLSPRWVDFWLFGNCSLHGWCCMGSLVSLHDTVLFILTPKPGLVVISLKRRFWWTSARLERFLRLQTCVGAVGAWHVQYISLVAAFSDVPCIRTSGCADLSVNHTYSHRFDNWCKSRRA